MKKIEIDRDKPGCKSFKNVYAISVGSLISHVCWMLNDRVMVIIVLNHSQRSQKLFVFISLYCFVDPIALALSTFVRPDLALLFIIFFPMVCFVALIRLLSIGNANFVSNVVVSRSNDRSTDRPTTNGRHNAPLSKNTLFQRLLSTERWLKLLTSKIGNNLTNSAIVCRSQNVSRLWTHQRENTNMREREGLKLRTHHIWHLNLKYCRTGFFHFCCFCFVVGECRSITLVVGFLL